MKPMFDLPPTYACLPVRVEVPFGPSRVAPLTPAERRMIAEIKAFERGDRTPVAQPQGPVPGVSAIRAAIHGDLRRQYGGARVLTAADVRPFTDAERALFGQIKAEDNKRLLDSRSVQRGIERGTERTRRKLLTEDVPSAPGWESFEDWRNGR